MIENDIVKLSEMSDRSLDGLEDDIWDGVDARIKAKRHSKVVLSCQAAVFAVAVTGSIALGTQAGMAFNDSPELITLSTRADLSPSTLLIGR